MTTRMTGTNPRPAATAFEGRAALAPIAMFRRVAGTGLAALLLAAGAFGQQRFDFDSTPGRLSKDVRPSRYELTLSLDPSKDAFAGTETIALAVKKPVDSILLHATDLTAGEAHWRAGSSDRALAVREDAQAQTWRLEPADGQPIAAGEGALSIAWAGKVHVADEGLYRSEYRVGDRTERMLTTQLEAISARSVFPSFDEPAFRAAFALAVRAPKGYDVFSNMPLESRAADPADGSIEIHRFAATPPMPSYLFAVTVGHVDVLAGEAAGVPLRILTAPGKRDQAAYAMRVTQQVLPYYGAYFGVPYALPKLDQIAVPSVRTGAMEDWGLISYAETDILFDPKKTDAGTQREVYDTMAHEIAHQWFGDLVTAASWEEIWLNEAFATWMATKATDRFNPAWQVRLRARIAQEAAMARDASDATRPIRSGPVTESAVENVFDSITYEKGGAVLSMLEAWIGAERFRTGLAAYMADRRFSNATATDLWFHIGAAAGRDVAGVAASWTDQPGFPLLSVSTACRAGRTKTTLAQQRFAALPLAGLSNGNRNDGAAPLWRIPVTLAQGTRRETLLLDAREKTLLRPGCGTEPLIANAGGAGFYRVRYAPDAEAALTRRFPSLAGADQVALLEDGFALMQAGLLTPHDWLALVSRLPAVAGDGRETLYSIAVGQFDFLDAALAGVQAREDLRKAGRALFGGELKRLGFDARAGESAESTTLRSELIEQLARFGDVGVLDEAGRRFDDDDAGRAALPASIRSAVIRAVGTQADDRRFDRLLARLEAADGEQERQLYAAALASGNDAAHAERLMNAVLGGITAPNVASSMPGLVGRRSDHGELAWRFTLANWDALAALAGPMFGRNWLLPATAARFNGAERIEPLKAAQRDKVGLDGEAAASQTAAGIALRATVKQRDSKALSVALRGWRPAAASPSAGSSRLE